MNYLGLNMYDSVSIFVVELALTTPIDTADHVCEMLHAEIGA